MVKVVFFLIVNREVEVKIYLLFILKYIFFVKVLVMVVILYFIVN